MMKKILTVCCGMLCILYCIASRFAGVGTNFYLIWGVMGIGLILCGLLAGHLPFLKKLPKWMTGTVKGLIWVGVLVFVVTELLVCSKFHAKAKPGADYVVILGAQWKTYGPSDVLRRRLDAAVTYLKANPDTKVIVSGGQGSNERISEAEGMAGYLQAAGIDAGRILLEDKSTNTTENMVFSAKLFDVKKSRTVIVTNNFHMYRALKLAKKQGYNAEGLAADSVWIMVPNNMLREFFGIWKDFLCGHF